MTEQRARAAPLSPSRLQKARRGYDIFAALNAFSFVLLTGSFLTLFAMRLGASKAVLGALNALSYATFFFLPLGKRIIRKRPIIWVFGWGYVARYALMLPILLAPAFAAAGQQGIAIGLVLAGAAGFSLFRGIATISNNPALDYIAAGGGEKPRADRASFIVTVSIINSVSAMAASLMASIILGEDATPGTYALVIAIAIAIGFAGCFLIFRIPEPVGYKPEDSESLGASVREAFRDPSFRVFIEVFMVLAFVGGMARSFLPVYAKDVFRQGDDAIMVYALLGSLGSVAMGLISRLVVDRLGSKPLFVIYSGIALISIIPIALVPGGRSLLRSPTSVAMFLAFLHSISAFGFSGEESSGQTYYFSLIPKRKVLDLAVVYFFAYGVGGAVGSGTGGILLDLLSWIGLDTEGSYRILYAFLSLVLVLVLVRTRRLKKLGSATIAQSLGVLFSPRDLRAFDLLARLDRSETPAEEVRLIHEIGASASAMSQSELAAYLGSPRFEVRMEALLALENMPTLDQRLVKPLMREVEKNVFTTAYVAARVLGKHQKLAALPCLRKATEAEDYMLQGNAMTSLAKMGDTESVPLIQAALMKASNPRVRIAAAYALEVLGAKESLPSLAASLRHDDPPAYVSDEIVLAMASLLGFQNAFYPLYSAFLEESEEGLAMLRSAAAETLTPGDAEAKWGAALDALFSRDSPDGRAMTTLVLDSGHDSPEAFVLAAALTDPVLAYPGLRFLAAAYPVLKPADRADRS